MSEEFRQKLKEVALNYLKKGFSVLPIREGDVKTGNKRPALDSWAEFQTRIPTKEEVEGWFESPKYNLTGVGIICGEVSGIIVLDFESTNALIDFQMDFQKRWKIPVPTTPIAKTGGGGWHLYLKYPQGIKVGNSIRFRQESDLKGTGGYVIAPPSLHKSGKQYEWNKNLNTPLAELPNEFFKEIIEKRQTATKEELERILKGVQQGERNIDATKLLGHLLPKYDTKDWETICWELLLAWNGSRNQKPLGVPELRTVFESICKRELAKRKGNQRDIESPLTPISLQELMQKDFPETQWVIEKLIPASGVSALSGYSGACKTWIALQMAIEVAKGGRLFDQFPVSKSPVLLIDEEMGEKWLRKRIEMLGGNKDLPIYILSKKGFRLEEDKVAEILEFCKAKEIKFLIIDSFSQVNTAENENDAMEAVKVFKQMQRFCQDGIAVQILHHHRKPSLYQGNSAHDMRGSSVILNQVDVHLVSEYRKREGTLIITQEKMRHDQGIQPFKLTIVSDENSYSLEFNDFIELQETFTEKYKEALEEYLKNLEIPIRQKELLEALRPQVGGGESAFTKAVKLSVAEGKAFEAKGGYRNKKYLWHSPITREMLEEIKTKENLVP